MGGGQREEPVLREGNGSEDMILVWTSDGVSINGGTPIAGWFIVENPIKMDDDWGYLYLGNHQIYWQ